MIGSDGERSLWVEYPFGLSAGVGLLAALVCVTFGAYLVGTYATRTVKLLFGAYVVFATLLYAVALVWGNVEQRRSRRAAAAPEFVLEADGGALVASNVGRGPAIDVAVTVSVDGERVYEGVSSVVRSGDSWQVGALDFDADADVVLRVRAETHLTDVTYTVDRSYTGETLVSGTAA